MTAPDITDPAEHVPWPKTLWWGVGMMAAGGFTAAGLFGAVESGEVHAETARQVTTMYIFLLVGGLVVTAVTIAVRESRKVGAKVDALAEALREVAARLANTEGAQSVELDSVKEHIAKLDGAVATIQGQISAAVAGTFDPATKATLIDLNREILQR